MYILTGVGIETMYGYRTREEAETELKRWQGEDLAEGDKVGNYYITEREVAEVEETKSLRDGELYTTNKGRIAMTNNLCWNYDTGESFPQLREILTTHDGEDFQVIGLMEVDVL